VLQGAELPRLAGMRRRPERREQRRSVKCGPREYLWNAFGTHMCSTLGYLAPGNAQFLPAPGDLERLGNGIGTLARYAGRVCIGLPATAVVADMLVGTPLRFASALEQAPDRKRTNGARPGSAMATFAVEESRSFPSARPTRRTPERAELQVG
jgi:hypothetical protein